MRAALASAPAETQNYVPKVLGAAGIAPTAATALPPGRIMLGSKQGGALTEGQQKIAAA